MFKQNKKGFTPHLFQSKPVVREGYKAKPPIGSDYLLPQALTKSGGGFTIIEMLAAVFFISIGMIGVLTAIQQTMTYADVSSSRLTAIYLAQEGIEIARNTRDGNWLAEAAWDNNLGLGNWEADYQTQALTDTYDGDFLLIDGGFYNYSSGTSTSFRREIIVSDKQDLDGDTFYDQMKVTVIVRWEAKGEHQISAEEFLYNWR